MKIIIKFFFNGYLLHSKWIRYWQKKRKNYLFDRMNLIREFSLLDTTEKRWNRILQKITYRSDPLWQFKDAVTDPYTSLIEGFDDCDGYAAIASKFLGTDIPYEKEIYRLDGLYFAFYKKEEGCGGHCIAIWKNIEKNKKTCVVVSTKKLSKHKNLKEAILDNMNGDIYYAVKCSVPKGIEFDLKLEKIYTGKELNELTL